MTSLKITDDDIPRLDGKVAVVTGSSLIVNPLIALVTHA